MISIVSDEKARSALRQVFDAAVASAAPGPAVLRHLPARPKGRCVVVGAGKASAAMAAALDAAWPNVPLSGLVVTRYGHAVPAGRIEIVEAAHPVPDANGELAARRILDKVQGLGPDDLVIALISGGGSALLPLPAQGMTLADKQAVNQALLASGATITEMNAVRKHLSAIKGGRLAAAASPARVVTLVISDVPGDDPAIIASGPTLPDTSTVADVRAIVARYGIDLPPSASAVLARGEETPKPGQIATDVRIIAAPAMALATAARKARGMGLTPLILGDALEGEAREMGTIMAGIARSVRDHGLPVRAPALILSGGETTVSIGKGPAGRGGRNTEFLLGFAVAMAGESGVWAIAGDSDGIDGTEDAAGALVTPDTLARGRAKGLDARTLLDTHDSYTFFQGIGDLVVTGPTLTNVNDIRAILVA
ncbi:MAG: glycerate kinase [Azospirillaceae bacterium]|nr:glycerate kinase [Azospirillaceae bacterium]